MVRVRGPLLSLSARGWLGHVTYARFGVVRNPYPISLLPFYYRGYHVPAFGLRPDPDFISKYYSHTGWTYQMRRTWHGIQPTIGHQPLFTDRQSIYQISRRWLFYYAKQALKTMSPATLNLYKLMRYPDHVLPENRFVRMYMRENIAPSTSQGYILNEDGSIIKTEDDHFIVQET